MNRRTRCKPLSRDHCRALEHAWHQAARAGYPLNAMISIRPTTTLSPDDHAALITKFWNRLGVWSRRATKPTPSFNCILVREAKPNGKNQFGVGEHFHALLHVPIDKFVSLQEAVTRWHPEPGEAHVRRAHHGVGRSPNGKIRSALGYVTKQRTQKAWWNSGYSRQPGGIVLGKRYRISAGLRAKPVDITAVRPVIRRHLA